MMYIIKLLVSAFLWTAISAIVTWDKQWLNSSSPYANGTELESLPNATYLNTICPNGSGTLKIQCKDDSGEPFVGMLNRTASFFFATCNIQTGLICNPWAGYNTSCPDMELNFRCDIPDTTTAPAVTPKQDGTPSQNLNSNPAAEGQSDGTSPTVTDDPVGSNNRNRRNGNDGSKAISSSWLIALILAFFLFK